MSLKKEIHLMLGTSRINPVRYFSYLGVAYIVMLILMGVGVLVLRLAYPDNIERAADLAFNFHTVFLQSAYLVVNLWWLARRLHDFNVSGWWVLVPLISLFLLMMIIMFQIPIPQLMNMALFILGVGSLLILTILGIFPGKLGKDDYGPRPPKNTIYNYIFFVIFVGAFFGYLIWRLLAIFGMQV